MVTAYGKEDVIEEATNAGIDSILMKPITNSTLYDTILKTVVDKDQIIQEFKKRDVLPNVEHLSGKRILLVEDNLINQQVALENLEALGFVVEVANHGKEAIEK